MNERVKKLFLAAITAKLNRGEDLDTILASYEKLTEDERAELAAFFRGGRRG